MNNKLLMPQSTIFERGSINQLEQQLVEFGTNGLIVHGKSFKLSGNKDKLTASFTGKIKADFFSRYDGEPTLDEVKEVISRAKYDKAQWIVGIGGGSAIDCAKAAAGLFNSDQDLTYYHQGGKITNPGIPFVAVPTTAGSGAEATPNAVIINCAKKEKLSIRDNSFLAKKVILDADLLKGLPKKNIAYSGMDAYVQAYEAYTSKNATADTDSFALKALQIIDASILPAYQSSDLKALENLLLASYMAGIAFTSARLGVIHGISHPLGGLYEYPHGLICAVCLQSSLRINREIIKEKYDRISELIQEDFVSRVGYLLQTMNISSPFKGLEVIKKERIISDTLKSGSTLANPKTITRQDIELILADIF